MICNECEQKQCREKVTQDKDGRFICVDHVPINKTWPLWEQALSHPQGLHDVCTKFNIKLKGV